MLRKRKTKRPRTLPVLDEDSEVTKQSVDCENNPEDSCPDTVPAASCSLDRPSEREKGLQAAAEESPVDLLKRIEALEEERDFLRQTLASVCGKEKKKKKKKKDTSSESDASNSSSSSSSSSSLLSSSSEDERCRKKKSKKKKTQKIRSRSALSSATVRVVAEIQIIEPEFYRSIPQFQPQQEKLFDFAQRCSEALTNEVKASIISAKKSGKLLPIKYKFR
ncbi:Coiled-coil domain-containing protein 106 [Labeo rohita]|uniref:Coiled-coil domain-containing protein 106 n=1 Tax=Labeo rohita TaxID=84645 RepID=A0ABQ8L9C9_LABRO|nr:Coiled-coil domain-containing protein 106 [Labeo rohita]